MVGFVKQSEKQMAEMKQQQAARHPLTLDPPGTATPRTAAKKRRFEFDKEALHNCFKVFFSYYGHCNL